MTSGTAKSPPNMWRILATWLNSASAATRQKSPNMMSTTGLRPLTAAPSAMPTKPFSQIGVPNSRSGKRSSTPRVDPLTPPRSRWTSSPMTTMRGSRVMFAAIAELAARPRSALMQEAITDRLDHHRAAALLDDLERPLHALAHRDRVHAVELDRRDAEHRPARGQPGLAGLLGHRGRDRVEIVLQEEDDRQAVERRQVHRLVGRAVHQRAGAEVADRDSSVAVQHRDT